MPRVRSELKKRVSFALSPVEAIESGRRAAIEAIEITARDRLAAEILAQKIHLEQLIKYEKALQEILQQSITDQINSLARMAQRIITCHDYLDREYEFQLFRDVIRIKFKDKLEIIPYLEFLIKRACRYTFEQNFRYERTLFQIYFTLYKLDLNALESFLRTNITANSDFETYTNEDRADQARIRKEKFYIFTMSKEWLRSLIIGPREVISTEESRRQRLIDMEEEKRALLFEPAIESDLICHDDPSSPPAPTGFCGVVYSAPKAALPGDATRSSAFRPYKV